MLDKNSADLDLDWNRLRSGDRRALIADHQDVFDMVAAKNVEIERLREAVAERDEELRSLRLIIANKDARFQRIREALGE